MEDEIVTYFRQLGLGVKQSFFEYYYMDEMDSQEKILIDEKVKLAIEILKNRLKKGYEEYCNIYDENYQFIMGVLLGNAATHHYYKFKRTIKELIDFYTLDELQEIVKDEYRDILFETKYLPKRSFFEYFYKESMTEEEKNEINEKVKLALKYQSFFTTVGYNIFYKLYNENYYLLVRIRKINKEEKNQLQQLINKISSLIEPYSLKELQEMCEDIGIDSKKLVYS